MRSQESSELSPALVLELSGVAVTIDANPILAGINFQIFKGQRWVVIGPNGGGKSTFIRLCGLALHPSVGDVTFLHNTLGRCDIRPLRARIGTSSASLGDSLRSDLAAEQVVMCGLYGALEPWWHSYTDQNLDRAQSLLDEVGLGGFGSRRIGSLSSGERQRVLLARGLMPNPDLLLLDEPMAGLDLGGRESLVQALDELGPDGPATILVTHHVEDIPPSFDHLLGVAKGKQVAAGAISETLDSRLIETLFGVKVELAQTRGRWHARVID